MAGSSAQIQKIICWAYPPSKPLKIIRLIFMHVEKCASKRTDIFHTAAWLEDEIPCHICPSRFANLDKQPKAVYAYYKKKCLACPHLEKYNKFYE